MYNKLYSNDLLERKLFSIEKQLTSFENNFHPATDENNNNNNNKQSHKHTCNLSVVLSLSPDYFKVVHINVHTYSL